MKRPSPATAIALVALFFSLGGVSLAAARYVITSTAQIKPSVLKELRGQRGPAGPAGVNGIPGAMGSVGAQGIQGGQGPQGVAGTPAAQPPFAEVDASGQFTGDGVTSVTHTANSGIYCITAPGTASHFASVTLTADSDVGAFAAIDFTAPDCPAGQTEVFTGVAVVGASNTEGSPFEGDASDEPFVIVYP